MQHAAVRFVGLISRSVKAHVTQAIFEKKDERATISCGIG
jgi:hypothetical protein